MHSISFKEPLDVKLKAIKENTLGQFQLINNFLTTHAPRMIADFHYDNSEATTFCRMLSDTLSNLGSAYESIERLIKNNAYLDQPLILAGHLRSMRRDIYSCASSESASPELTPLEELGKQFKIIDSLRGYEYDAKFRTELDGINRAITTLHEQEGIITRLITSLERIGRDGVKITL